MCTSLNIEEIYEHLRMIFKKQMYASVYVIVWNTNSSFQVGVSLYTSFTTDEENENP